jgi:methanogenic corrinoid protein MtbC1
MTNPISKKPIYNLNLVLLETGIKADTLRAWEKRYDLPQPDRSKGGHRLFSEYDIETIKWLMQRQEEGMRISRAVDLWNSILSNGQDPLFSPPTEQTMKPAGSITPQDSEALDFERTKWVEACLNFDETAAEQVLTQSFAQFSLETVCIKILQAGLAEIGSLWYQGKASIQQEHFASELAVRKLHALISAAPKPVRSDTILVSCPEAENHVFSPLLIAVLLRYRSWNVIFLGANVPKIQFKETIQKTHPSLIVMTAMRLTTAATLLDTALYIQDLNVPVAFGGRIFNYSPDLITQIPGYFLGEDLQKAITAVENLLLSPLQPLEYHAEVNRFADTIDNYIERKPLIEVQVLHKMADKYKDLYPERIFQEVNNFLSQDILAALFLGDMNLLGSNVEWVKNLLGYRELSQDLISDYLEAYAGAARSHLPETGRPITAWLEAITGSRA